MWNAANNPGLPALSILLVVLVSACATKPFPKSALRLEQSTLEVRSVQRRKLAAPSEVAILTAAVAVLQDMEFNIDRIEKPLGVMTASKVSDADNSKDKAGLFFLDLLCAAGGNSSCANMSMAKDKQHIILTLVVLPSLEHTDEYSVRATVQRIIFDKAGRARITERITSPEVYQEVFNNLRKALLIEVSES